MFESRRAETDGQIRTDGRVGLELGWTMRLILQIVHQWTRYVKILLSLFIIISSIKPALRV